MSRIQDASPDLRQLLPALCDEEASQADLDSLETLVGRGDNDIDLVVEYLQLHSDLVFEFRTRQASEEVLREIGLAPVTLDDTSTAMPAVVETWPPAPAANLATTPIHGTFHCGFSGWPMAYLIATVVFGIGLLVGAFTHVSNSEQVAVNPTPRATRPKAQSPSRAELVGRITGMVNCKWVDRQFEACNGDFISLGRKYDLASGLLEITYDTGAMVILQGPVTYEVESKNGGFINIGKLAGKVETTKAKGFVVRTPTATVTDLGTEFGVEVSTNGRTAAHVFRGSIAVRVIADDGVSANREVALHENEAACVERATDQGDSFAVVRATAEPARFTRVLPESKSPTPSSGNAYAEYVLSLKPAVYYRMEPPPKQDEPWTLYDFAPGGQHGMLHCDKAFRPPPYLDGRYGKSLLFRGQMVMDHAIVPNYPKATSGQLTVSAWVMALSRPRWATIAGNWSHWDPQHPPQPLRGQFYLGLCSGDGDLAAVILARRDKSDIIVREGASKPLPLGQWQHVAFVVDRSVARLYRNGVEVASEPCDMLPTNSPVSGLAIGCMGTDVGDAQKEFCWHGRIDELAIFHSALPAETVLRLYQSEQSALPAPWRSP